MIFQEIAYDSAAYRQECELRHQVLRVPLGLSLYAEDLSREGGQLHFGLFDGGVLVACVIAVAVAPTAVKLRQMAVAAGHQRQGHGRTLVGRLEEHLARRGYVHCTLHARLSAEAFYQKLGYVRRGREFIEVGIPHVCMEKDLA